jgi:hypothetical protein
VHTDVGTSDDGGDNSGTELSSSLWGDSLPSGDGLELEGWPCLRASVRGAPIGESLGARAIGMRMRAATGATDAMTRNAKDIAVLPSCERTPSDGHVGLAPAVAKPQRFSTL